MVDDRKLVLSTSFNGLKAIQIIFALDTYKFNSKLYNYVFFYNLLKITS